MHEISLKKKDRLDAREYRLRKNFEMTDSYPLHWHEYYELEICLGGKGIQKLNGTEYELSAGSVTLLRMTDFHEYIFTTPCKLLCLDFTGNDFSGNCFRELIKTRGDIHAVFEDGEYETLMSLSRTLIDEYDSEREYMIDAIEKLVDYICMMLLRHVKHKEVQQITDSNNQIKNALEYIDIHFREPLPLEEVAAVAGYSKNYFSQRFFATVGVTYSQYLQRKKISYSKLLLRSTDHSVVEVSMECGYASLSNFNRAFKYEVGMSPSDYRRHKLKNK